MHAEVLIIGAGPAGATAAAILARSGRQVVLLDQHSFPRPKICGDGIPGSVLSLLQANAGLPPAFTNDGSFYWINEAKIGLPDGFEVLFSRPAGGVVCPREVFDNLLLDHAKRAGARFAQGKLLRLHEVPGKLREATVCVQGQEQRWRAKLIIGADGFASRVAKALNSKPPRPDSIVVSLRGYLDGFAVNAGQLEFYALNPFRPGYAWIFPTGGRQANIGVGLIRNAYPNRADFLHQLLADFMNRPQIRNRIDHGARLDRLAMWPLPLAGEPGVRRTGDGVMLVGDAARLVNPMDGGGIFSAVASACIAARVADQALQQDNTSAPALSRYDALCRKFILAPSRRLLHIRKILQRHPGLVNVIGRVSARHPWLLNQQADVLTHAASRLNAILNPAADV